MDKVVVITGASSGIGQAAALAYAAGGYTTVLAARRMEQLEQVASQCRKLGPPSLVVPTDVANADQVNNLVATALQEFKRIDVMINNAGYGLHARVHQTTEPQMRQIMDVNFMGVFYGCRAVVPVMQAQGSGHIFNVSSVIGKRGSPFNGAYSASKFAVAGLTEAMRVELKDQNIRVTLVCPGLTQTEFFDHVVGGGSSRSSFVKVRGLMPPETIAQKMVRATGRQVPEMVFSSGGKFLVVVSCLWPALADRIMKVYYDDLVKRER